MKIFLAMAISVGCIFAAYTIYEVRTLRGEYRDLNAGVRDVTVLAQGLEDVRQSDNLSMRWEELNLRLTRLEGKLEAPDVVEEGMTGEGDLATIQATLQTQGEEIAEIRKDLEGVRGMRGALDTTADRVLSAVGQEPEAGGGGLAGLMEMGALFRKSPEELTEEEKARRDEITSQLARRRDEWAVRAFDRSLEVKLTDDQKASIQQLLAEESSALEAARGQESSEEERAAARAQIREQTDQRAAGVLTTDQYESWKTYRSRSGERASGLGRFGFGR